MEELKIVVQELKGDVLTILQGDAPTPLKLREPQPLIVDGSLESVIDFGKKRPDLIKPENCLLIINTSKIEALLIIGDRDEINTKITGSLRVNADALIGINSQTTKYTAKSLYQKLKLRRDLFPSREQQSSFLAALQKFEAKIETEVKDHDDYKGNVVYSKITKVQTEIPLVFNINAEFIVGKGKKEVVVDVEVTANQNSLDFNLISPDLFEYMKQSTDEALQKVADSFSAIPIIYQ